jgi:polyhydroxyalkanoate synthesis regulator phasin
MSVLKDTSRIALAAIQASHEKAEQVIDDLIKKGELDKSRRTEAILELLQEAESVASEIRAKVGESAEVARRSTAIVGTEFGQGRSFATQSEFSTLERRVGDLAKAIDDIRRKLGT